LGKSTVGEIKAHLGGSAPILTECMPAHYALEREVRKNWPGLPRSKPDLVESRADLAGGKPDFGR